MKCDKTVRKIIARVRSERGKKNGVIGLLWDDYYLEMHMAKNKRINKRGKVNVQAELQLG